MAGLRVVLDTNVLVSGLAYPASIPGRIVQLCRHGGLELVLSRYILDEMVRVLPRLPRVRLAAEEVRDLAESFVFLTDIVEPEPGREVELRDQADQPVLGTLKVSGAQYLITDDNDLLALANRYPIVSPAAFWAKHG